MPTYDYHCKDCKHEFEEFQNISDPALTLCPICGGSVHRIISGGSGLIFKGSGFYITDYQKKNQSDSQTTNKAANTTKDKQNTDTKANAKNGSQKKRQPKKAEGNK